MDYVVMCVVRLGCLDAPQTINLCKPVMIVLERNAPYQL